METEFIRFNINGETYDIPKITNAKKTYSFVQSPTCNCPPEIIQPTDWWHFDGIYTNESDNSMYFCVTCNQCNLKFISPFNMDTMFFFINKSKNEYKVRK